MIPRGVAAAVLIVAGMAQAHAAGPGGLLLQRRGVFIPAKPANVDSGPEIDSLNKALKALGSTDRDYDGHREKAIAHIGAAIRHIEMPNARGRSDSAVDAAVNGHAAAPTRTATTPQAASDEAMRKAKTVLFDLHHRLEKHTLTVGQKKADAEVRIAITEIVNALNPPKAKATSATPTTTSASTTSAAKPGK
jgi:hypothetical protein